jgi:HEAT repeat protein
MSKTIPILLMAFLWLNPGEAAASDATVSPENQVLNLLRGYEWQLDLEASNVSRALPADTDRILLDIARGDGHPEYVKSRALEALGYFPNDDVWAFLESELAIAEPIKRRRVVETICRVFSEGRPRQVEAVISDYLQQPDAHLRVTVARCLQAIGSESAMQKIKSYQMATAETAELWERDALNR